MTLEDLSNKFEAGTLTKADCLQAVRDINDPRQWEGILLFCDSGWRDEIHALMTRMSADPTGARSVREHGKVKRFRNTKTRDAYVKNKLKG